MAGETRVRLARFSVGCFLDVGFTSREASPVLKTKLLSFARLIQQSHATLRFYQLDKTDRHTSLSAIISDYCGVFLAPKTQRYKGQNSGLMPLPVSVTGASRLVCQRFSSRMFNLAAAGREFDRVCQHSLQLTC